MSKFIYNGIDSDELGLLINSITPPPCSQEEYENIQIPGRPESLRVNKKTRQNISITVNATIIEPHKLRTIYYSLQGQGKLISSKEPDKFYYASPQIITPENIVLEYHTMSIAFDCLPFAYLLDNVPVTLTSSESTIDISGNVYCQPVYKIYGNGDITLRVNNTPEPLRLRDVSEYVIVDSTALMCHKDGIVVWNSGKLPFMAPGTNIVKWSGNASKIEIVKNERWI